MIALHRLSPAAKPVYGHNVQDEINCDVAIAGGGLAGGLIALALAEKRPDLDVRLIESSPVIGGNHLWSFFDSDIAPKDRWLLDPLICHTWPDYDVYFPAHRRTLHTGYNSIESERLDAVVRAKLQPDRIIVAAVSSVENGVTLFDGRSIAARVVIDARGPADLTCLDVGWQKFLGQKLRIRGGHGLERPIVMDATVLQNDGYRFLYCLPFDAETVFVEDTYYSEGPALDPEALRQRIAAYAQRRGWQIEAIEREETGVLPVAMGGDFASYWESGGSVAKAGMRAGLFHPTTGYSLPDAVRLASAIADDPEMTPTRARAYAKKRWEERRFYRMLDTMLFRASEPDKEYKVLERFYRLSPPLIERFYAGRSTFFDKIRILSGKPPVPIGRAIRAILGYKS
jgi:lycopene beta-cyclase